MVDIEWHGQQANDMSPSLSAVHLNRLSSWHKARLGLMSIVLPSSGKRITSLGIEEEENGFLKIWNSFTNFWSKGKEISRHFQVQW